MTSKSIRSVGYDAEQRRLQIEFHTGRTYEYDDVPGSVFDWLMRVKNKGRFVTRMISPRFAYRELGSPAAAVAADLEHALVASLRELERRR